MVTDYHHAVQGEESALALSADFAAKAGDFQLAAKDESALSSAYTTAGNEAATLAAEFESEATD